MDGYKWRVEEALIPGLLRLIVDADDTLGL
jgi:hypothetical protein